MPHLQAWQWTLGALCAFLAGVAKTGVPGLGILVVPLMVLTVGQARQSAGWLLPLLCAADVCAVIYYRSHAQARRLWQLSPFVAVGMALGSIALAWPERIVRPLVGAIVVVMIVAQLLRRVRPGVEIPHSVSFVARYGIAAGFATMVANAAGPVMNVYLLSQRLPKEEFMATGAWLFLFINLSKLPVYGYRGLIGGGSLLFDFFLLPALILGTLSGRRLFRLLPQRAFEASVLVLTAAATLLLFL